MRLVLEEGSPNPFISHHSGLSRVGVFADRSALRRGNVGTNLSTTDRDEVDALTKDYPKRWHVEEFFNTHQSMGWRRGGTQNLNIRYAQMTTALIAQAVVDQLRVRLGEPFSECDANHLAKDLFFRMDGDVRVRGDTILVTYYNAPNAERLRTHYEALPKKLAAENVNPEIPWLSNYKLDFRFR